MIPILFEKNIQNLQFTFFNSQFANYFRLLIICYQLMEQNKTQSKNFVGMHGQPIGLGFTSRDKEAKNQQEQRIIEFKVIRNDQSHENMKYLLDLKNIFARQLPKMPKQYIVKLVFDRNHQSMVIMKGGSKVIGGICFRIFQAQKFAEIAFLAITSTEQIRGYGTRLMNKLKEQMQRRSIQYMMTYADNLALGYFRKQGFSKDCRMPQQRWKGYIKDYEGGTMMQCFIHPTINYSQISQNIKKQKEILIKKIKEISMNENTFQGQNVEKIRRQNGQFTRKNADGTQDNYKINPLLIPGIAQGGWSWQDSQQLKKSKQISFQLQCTNIIDQMKKHSSAWPFREPVSSAQVPDYNLVVKQPIDLKTIQRKLISGQYNSKESFASDVKRIFTNARLYNQPQTVYYKSSIELQDFITPHLQKFLNSNDSEIVDVAKALKTGGSKKRGQRK